MPISLPNNNPTNSIISSEEDGKQKSNESSLEFSAEVITELRNALISDVGKDYGWSDEEIRRMALDTLQSMKMLAEVGEAQLRRGIKH